MRELHSCVRPLLQLSDCVAGAPISVRLQACKFGEWVSAVTLAEVPDKCQLRVLLAEPGTPPLVADAATPAPAFLATAAPSRVPPDLRSIMRCEQQQSLAKPWVAAANPSPVTSPQSAARLRRRLW